MSLVTAPSTTERTQNRLRRIWKVPASRAKWLWLAVCIVLFVGIGAWYLYAIKTQQAPGPFDDPLRLFGIISYVIVIITVSYTLRRRFVRGLPGKVQDWLWLHIWAGITAILIAMFHENFAFVTHDFVQGVSDLTGSDWGGAALFALIFLVVSGIIGRFLDIWQTHVIAHEASTNGVGIVQSLQERIRELEYTVERLCAGKSEPFKAYCLQVMGQKGGGFRLLDETPELKVNETVDFQSAAQTLKQRARLVQSLQRQMKARQTIRTWRTIHIILATLAVLIILYHGTLELLSNVFHLIPAA
jgi:hypothetical protein